MIDVLPHERQYIILSPEEDGVLNFSYVYGNMYTDTIDLNSSNHVILKDKETKQPIIISLDTKLKIEEKEIEALTENIIKEYGIEFRRKVTEKDIFV